MTFAVQVISRSDQLPTETTENRGVIVTLLLKVNNAVHGESERDVAKRNRFMEHGCIRISVVRFTAHVITIDFHTLKMSLMSLTSQSCNLFGTKQSHQRPLDSHTHLQLITKLEIPVKARL